MEHWVTTSGTATRRIPHCCRTPVVGGMRLQRRGEKSGWQPRIATSTFGVINSSSAHHTVLTLSRCRSDWPIAAPKRHSSATAVYRNHSLSMRIRAEYIRFYRNRAPASPSTETESSRRNCHSRPVRECLVFPNSSPCGTQPGG